MHSSMRRGFPFAKYDTSVTVRCTDGSKSGVSGVKNSLPWRKPKNPTQQAVQLSKECGSMESVCFKWLMIERG